MGRWLSPQLMQEKIKVIVHLRELGTTLDQIVSQVGMSKSSVQRVIHDSEHKQDNSDSVCGT